MNRFLVICGIIILAAGGGLVFWYSQNIAREDQVAGNTNTQTVQNNVNIEGTVAGEETVQAPEQNSASIHPVSLPALFEKNFNGSDLKLGTVLAMTSSYTRYYITYSSGDLKISGIMNVPVGKGPFPVLILNHGHIDTSVYTNGRGLKREQDYLAKAGYAVLHPDYRNHADSSKDNHDELAVRLGYVEDVINAVYAVKSSNFSFIDKDRIGMLGHSMGGGITLSVITAQPDLVDAAILYAPVSGDMAKSYERWMSRRPETAKKIKDLYGDPASSPEFWEASSAQNFYDRIKAPVAIFHGTADESVPLEWSKNTKTLLEQRGKNVSLTIYNGAPHEFITSWPSFIQSTKEFFDKNI